jgi:hypothetical protein
MAWTIPQRFLKPGSLSPTLSHTTYTIPQQVSELRWILHEFKDLAILQNL